jgi:hypothetical protein
MKHAAILSVIAFLLHFAWENVQCPLFFVHGTYEATWRGMTTATLGDVVITWALYSCIAAVRRDWRWPAEGWKLRDWVLFVVVALLIGFAIELRALGQDRWVYRVGTPLVPGTSVSIIPLLQLLLLTPAVIELSEAATRRFGSRRSEVSGGTSSEKGSRQ